MPGRNSSSKLNPDVIDSDKNLKVRGASALRIFLFSLDLYAQVKYKASVRRGNAPEALKPENEKVQDNDEI